MVLIIGLLADDAVQVQLDPVHVQLVADHMHEHEEHYRRASETTTSEGGGAGTHWQARW